LGIEKRLAIVIKIKPRKLPQSQIFISRSMMGEIVSKFTNMIFQMPQTRGTKGAIRKKCEYSPLRKKRTIVIKGSINAGSIIPARKGLKIFNQTPLSKNNLFIFDQ
jgi:hypothetical protein